jgi:acyl-CoA dehydrogenase
MVFEISDEHRMLKDLVRKLVDDQLTPLEAGVLAREAAGQPLHLTAAEPRTGGN